MKRDLNSKIKKNTRGGEEGRGVYIAKLRRMKEKGEGAEGFK